MADHSPSIEVRVLHGPETATSPRPVATSGQTGPNPALFVGWPRRNGCSVVGELHLSWVLG